MIKDGIIVVGSEGTIGKCVQYGLTSLGCVFQTADVKGPVDILLDGRPWAMSDKTKLVISCATYCHNKNLAWNCITNKIPYCDLGGHVETSEYINELAYINESQCFTDLGLAPGWVNIVAEEKVSKCSHVPANVTMMVGGLPIDPFSEESGELHYTLTWSLEGLLNEYRDDCLILEDGELKTVEGMSGCYTAGGGKEAFYTSGGAAHTIRRMKELGVTNCSYKTLRWNGHNKLMRWLLASGIDDEVLGKLMVRPSKPSDFVEVRVNINGTYHFEKMVISDHRFSAMQMATAYPLISAALLMDEMPVKALGYEDVPFDLFNENLKNLGLTS